ncbi:MAG: Ig-like domain-containing protein, partial [Candidatus Riflebacteria bacterium]|nr:Ig-like domain-containing protein [Candidatus Riflebacteria bacterium]
KAITQTALNIQPSVIPTFSWQDSDSTMLIDFATPLAADTTYAFTLSTEATDQTGLKLAQPYTLSFKTDAPDSPDPATLTEYEPADTSTPVDLFAPVVLRFSAPIDQRTLNFEILPAIAGDFSTTWNEASTEVSVRFNSGYGSGISYTFSVLATTKDIYGQNIAEPDDFSFTAKTYVATRLIGVSPASGSAGIDPGSTFELTFDQAMNEGDVVSAISFSPALTGAVNYAWSDGSKKLTITHTDKLLLGTNYLLTIAQSYANQLISSYAISYKVAEALQIVENTPENNSAGVTTNQAVEFKFNNQINTETLALSFSPEPANGFTKSWSDNNRTLLLTPNSPGLAESTNYQVSVLVATKDIYGNSLPQNHVLAFSTGAVTPPAISSTFPLAGSYDVAVDQQIKIYFSKSMDREKTQAAVSLSPSVTPVFNWLDGDTTMIISVGDALSYDTSYQITIGTGATDKYGLSIEQGHLFGFKTVARPTVLVSKSYPLTNSTGIPPQAVIKIEFSKTMNKESAQTAFSLKQVSTSVNGSFSWSGNIMSFTPSASLAYGATYQISIAASAADSLGNSLAAAISWSFATAADEGKVWALEQANTENTTTFSQRSEHVMISFNNKLWVIGGFDGISYLNDIWSSSDGKSWTNETAAAAFPARSGHACIVYNGKIWMTGGYSYTDTDKFFDDVWSSSDGKNWVQVSNSADYYARSAHSMAVFADKLWIIGGETFDESNNLMLLDDCWSSSNGSSWQLRSTMVSFFPRKLHISGVINNRLWVWSGYGENSNSVEGALNDAWSTADGDYWRLETSNTAFPARCAAGYATFNNRTWLIGGANGDPYQAGTTYYNDIWASSDGTNWVQILGNSAGSATQFSPRVLHSAAALSDKLFISGGELASYYLNNEVWSTK